MKAHWILVGAVTAALASVSFDWSSAARVSTELDQAGCGAVDGWAVDGSNGIQWKLDDLEEAEARARDDDKLILYFLLKGNLQQPGT